jgi:hypothetical protein
MSSLPRLPLSSFALGLAVALGVWVSLAPRVARAEPRTLEDVGDDGGGPGRAGPFGLGLILGEPTGFSLKVAFSRDSAVQAHIGYGVGRRGKLLLAVDYLFHFTTAIGPVGRAGRLSPYVGIGGHLGVRENDDAILGLRIPIGLSFMISAAPLEVFAEVAPGMGVLPSTTVLVDGGLGLRFYF